MKTICTRCKSDEIYVVTPKEEKLEEETQTMDDFVKNVGRPVNAIYKMTTIRCKKCGYSASY